MADGAVDFRALARAVAAEGDLSAMVPVIEKELLHYEILNVMDQAGHLDHLVFQGGTCLRTCYGAERFSEDLDFAGGAAFDADRLAGLAATLERALTRRYQVEVEVDPPSPREVGAGVRVETWRIRVVTAAGRPGLPKQRINIQVATVPAHTKAVRPLGVRYAGLPASYGHVLVHSESLTEICADKLKAFLTSRFLRHRDLWDLQWIAAQPGFDTTGLRGLFERKVVDYGAAGELTAGARRLEQLGEIVGHRDFSAQLERFLPAAVIDRTLRRPAWRELLATRVRALYQTVGL
ncbi:MAG: nucleotidyl transferase AbiEii/AbiGii toxin family protein [Bifidobacteriaceae bacterium]|jgi:predicted nucleotidyltransferase component of viral defense system|nr:nucleotidyl transferase AbiEii/AbiGii toxin family protein [Bifidobacteriaceae bacterium]